MRKSELGTWGETLAAETLEDKGYRIIARNYRSRYGEIDLIARREAVLAFVEVKLRKSDRYGEAREYVTAQKQSRIRLTAALYLEAHTWAQALQPRFDVVEVYAPQGLQGGHTVTHLENAFE